MHLTNWYPAKAKTTGDAHDAHDAQYVKLEWADSGVLSVFASDGDKHLAELWLSEREVKALGAALTRWCNDHADSDAISAMTDGSRPHED